MAWNYWHNADENKKKEILAKANKRAKKARQKMTPQQKEKERERNRRYYAKNKERLAEQQKKRSTPESRRYHSEKGLEHYQNNKEKRLQQSKMRIERNAKWIFEYLLENPCIKCGEWNPVRLEFDHFKDKVAPVSILVLNGAALKKIQTEVEKCQVLCANCHREKTAREFNWSTYQLWEEYNKGR